MLSVPALSFPCRSSMIDPEHIPGIRLCQGLFLAGGDYPFEGYHGPVGAHPDLAHERVLLQRETDGISDLVVIALYAKSPVFSGNGRDWPAGALRTADGHAALRSGGAGGAGAGKKGC